jgi:hypothetical protein
MVKVVLGVVVLCALLFLIERYIGWPDWMTVEKVPRRLSVP